MKRLTCWIMAAALCCVPFSKSLALTLPADEPVVAYYMPLTQLLFTVEYDENNVLCLSPELEPISHRSYVEHG